MVEILRNQQQEIQEGLKNFPIVAILGPRQCGKSTLARKVCRELGNSIFLDLESPKEFNQIQNPEYFFQLNSDKLVCLDEIQRFPEIFPILRSVVDKNNRFGQILLLGSASIELLKQSSESLAGRILYIFLTPFSWNEIKTTEYKLETHWLRGGFPLSILRNSDKVSLQWREQFLRTICERDIPSFGYKIPSMHLYRFFMMLAHSHGQVLNKSKLGSSLGVSHNTISSYLDIFEELFYLRTIMPIGSNLKKRMVKSHKVYIRDSGLLHSVLQIDFFEKLLGHPVIGHSWEGYCIENILSVYPDYETGFYKTANGNEIDLVLTKGNHRIGFEFKLSSTPKAHPGLYRALEELELSQLTIISPNVKTYPIQEKIFVSGLEEVMSILKI